MENNRAVTTVSTRKQPSISPPYRKMRALRLFNSLAIPNTNIQKSTSKFMKSLATSTTREADLLAKPIEGIQAKANEVCQTPKCQITRYGNEFVELSLLGVGEFRLVYQCINRLDARV